MSYTTAWNEAAPSGGAQANTIDDIIRAHKLDMRERVGGIFGLSAGQFAADPIAPISLTLSGAFAAASATFAGAVGGITTLTATTLVGTLSTAAQPNVTSVGTLIATLNSNAQIPLIAGGQGTGYQYINMTNTGANLAFGIERSTGGALLTGSSAYSVFFGSVGATSLHLGTAGVTRFTLDSSGNATFTGTITGTLATAAQPNITSIGTQVATLGDTASLILAGTGQGVAFQYLSMINTSGSLALGIESSTGTSIFVSSAAYASVLGSRNATSLQFATNNTVRQTIDSAGNVVFTGTVTASNFVGPTSINANALTGTTLAANVIHSSLQDLGTLTALLVSAAPAFTVARTSGTNATALTLADTVTGTQTVGFGTRLVGSSNSNSAVSAIGFEAGGTGTNNESQIAFYTQASAGTLTRQMTIRSSGQVDFAGVITATSLTGNLTGTVLTAAQGNITSVGILTSLTVGGSIIANGASARVTVAAAASDSVGSGPNFYHQNVAGTVAFLTQLSASGHYDWWAFTGAWTNVGRFATTGQFLVGTTSITGVAAGGIHVAGNSVFDGTLTALTATLNGGVAGAALTFSGAGTSSQYISASSTGAQYILGLESSVGGTILVGGSAYATGFGTVAATSLQLGTNNTVRMTINSTGAVTFTAAVSGITTLTATTLIGILGTAGQTNVTSVGILTSLATSGNISLSGTDPTIFWAGNYFSRTISATGIIQIVSNNVVALSIANNAGVATFNAGVTATVFTGPLTGNVTGNTSGSSGSCTGLSATATALATPRAINGTNFDGTAAITTRIKADSTNVSNTGTGASITDVDLATYTLPTLVAGDSVEVWASWNVAGAAGTKALKFWLAGSTLDVIAVTAGASGNPFMRVIMSKNGTSTASHVVRTTDTITSSAVQQIGRFDALDLSGAIVKITGQTAVNTDEVTVNAFIVTIVKA